MAAWRMMASPLSLPRKSATAGAKLSALCSRAKAKPASRTTTGSGSLVRSASPFWDSMSRLSPKTRAAWDRTRLSGSFKSNLAGAKALGSLRAICPSPHIPWMRAQPGPLTATRARATLSPRSARANWASWRTRRSSWPRSMANSSTVRPVIPVNKRSLVDFALGSVARDSWAKR